MRSVKTADFPPKVIRCSAWLGRLQAIPHRATVNIDESLAKGFDRPWTTWRCLNRLRTGFTCSKEQRQKFQRLPPARGGTAQKKIIHLANWSQLIHPGPASSLTKFFLVSSQSCVSTLTHYSSELLLPQHQGL